MAFMPWDADAGSDLAPAFAISASLDFGGEAPPTGTVSAGASVGAGGAVPGCPTCQRRNQYLAGLNVPILVIVGLAVLLYLRK